MKWNKIEHDPETGRVEGLPEPGEYIFSFSNGTVAVDEIIKDIMDMYETVDIFLWKAERRMSEGI